MTPRGPTPRTGQHRIPGRTCSTAGGVDRGVGHLVIALDLRGERGERHRVVVALAITAQLTVPVDVGCAPSHERRAVVVEEREHRNRDITDRASPVKRVTKLPNSWFPVEKSIA